MIVSLLCLTVLLLSMLPLVYRLLMTRFDTPLNLYDNEDGLFFSLCQRSGITREDILHAHE